MLLFVLHFQVLLSLFSCTKTIEATMSIVNVQQKPSNLFPTYASAGLSQQS